MDIYLPYELQYFKAIMELFEEDVETFLCGVPPNFFEVVRVACAAIDVRELASEYDRVLNVLSHENFDHNEARWSACAAVSFQRLNPIRWSENFPSSRDLNLSLAITPLYRSIPNPTPTQRLSFRQILSSKDCPVNAIYRWIITQRV